MSALTPIAGYPCHRVVQFSRWTNPHGVAFTDWTGACGAKDTKAGQHRVFGKAGDARRLELCPTCFPGRIATGVNAPYFPDPVEVPSQREVRS
jgi:hypothetical protein